MDVWRITVAALRRWYILLPLLALTAVGAYVVGEGVKPQYEVNATGILVPGQVRSEILNPYGSMDTTNTVLAIVLGNNESRARIFDMGLDPDYQVSPQSRSTIMRFAVTSETPEIALGTGEAVIQLAREELAARQDAAGIPSVSQIGLDVLQPPDIEAVVTDGKLRNMAIVGLLGAALSLIAAVLFDDIVGLLRRWIVRRRARRVDGSTSRSERMVKRVRDTGEAFEGDGLDVERGGLEPDVMELETRDGRRARRDLAQARRDT